MWSSFGIEVSELSPLSENEQVSREWFVIERNIGSIETFRTFFRAGQMLNRQLAVSFLSSRLRIQRSTFDR